MKTCTQCKMRYPNEATFCFVEGAELVELPDPRIGTLVAGRYVVEEVIGEGGMATVYRARHKLVDRPVALKIMSSMLSTDAVVRERFRREARNAQKLAHPNIIEIYDQGDTPDGTCFIAMELLRGEPLSSVTQRGPMDIDRAVHAMIQMSRGIARAHDLEVIHRDVKPENIFLCRREDGSELVKLLDFGIARSRHDARLTSQGELFGTPQYMAPERILGTDSDGSGDLYALGVVFFEMVTGTLPFDAADVATFFIKHMNEPAPSCRERNRQVPEALERLIARMLAKEPKDRPVDGHRVHQDLLEVLASRQVAAPPSADAEPVSAAPPTLDASVGEPWTRRLLVLEQMLARAFGARQKAPGALTRLLSEADELVRRVLALRAEGIRAQRELEQIDLRGRDKRTQLGFAVDQLGVDASKAKEVLRAARDVHERASNEVREARARFEAAHREIVVWEGRSAFAEPWPELAEAYRGAAEAVEAWCARRREEQRAEQEAAAAERVVTDIDFQIRELRAALQKHEHELDELRERCRAGIEESGKEADRLETELLDRTTRFCEPLRERPELAPLFKELETDAAA